MSLFWNIRYVGITVKAQPIHGHLILSYDHDFADVLNKF